MDQTISIGAQSFEFIRKNECFFIDKTGLIKESAACPCQRGAAPAPFWENIEPGYDELFFFQGI